MNFQRQVSRALDEEHRANLELLDRVERAFGRASRPGEPRDPGLASLAGRLGRQIRVDIDRHFAFEEREVFPRMHETGDGDMAALLAEEHVAICSVADELIPLPPEPAPAGPFRPATARGSRA